MIRTLDEAIDYLRQIRSNTGYPVRQMAQEVIDFLRVMWLQGEEVSVVLAKYEAKYVQERERIVAEIAALEDKIKVAEAKIAAERGPVLSMRDEESGIVGRAYDEAGARFLEGVMRGPSIR